MATYTLTLPDVFPNGTVVGAYVPPAIPGAAFGSAVNEQTVASDTLTFTGLADGTRYVARGDNGRQVSFTTSPPVAGGGVGSGGVGDRFAGRCTQAAKAAQAGGQFVFDANAAFEAFGDSIVINGDGRVECVEEMLVAMALTVHFADGGDFGDADGLSAEISSDNADSWGPSNVTAIGAAFPNPKCSVSGTWRIAAGDLLSFVGRHDASTDKALIGDIYVVRVA